MAPRRDTRRCSARLRPVSRPRLYEQLVERLLDYIHSERMKVGDRLPAERELATQLGVSRASVSQALVALEVQGVIDVRHGDGAVILDVPAERQILAALRARRNRLREVIEAREALEVRLAALAARRCTPEDLQRLHPGADGPRNRPGRAGRELSRPVRGCAGAAAALMAGSSHTRWPRVQESGSGDSARTFSAPGAVRWTYSWKLPSKRPSRPLSCRNFRHVRGLRGRLQCSSGAQRPLRCTGHRRWM